jgi:hypothetical protein
MPDLLTQAQYARRRGVSRVAVFKALASGRITATPGPPGERLIDPELADRQWHDGARKGQLESMVNTGDDVMKGEREMLDAFSVWEKAKRDGERLDAEVAKADECARNLAKEEGRAQEALDSANNAANQRRALSGSATPAQQDAIARAERGLKNTTEARVAAQAVLADLQKRQAQSVSAIGAALHRAQLARVEYGSAAIESIQARLRASESVQKLLRELDQAMELGNDPRLALRAKVDWEDLILETFPRPSSLPKAA